MATSHQNTRIAQSTQIRENEIIFALLENNDNNKCVCLDMMQVEDGKLHF